MKCTSDTNTDESEKSESEDDQNEELEVEKETAFNPFDPFTIFIGLVWLVISVKMYFYLTTKNSSPMGMEMERVMATTAPDGEYFMSIIRMQELARVEQSIVAEMNAIMNNSSS